METNAEPNEENISVDKNQEELDWMVQVLGLNQDEIQDHEPHKFGKCPTCGGWQVSVDEARRASVCPCRRDELRSHRYKEADIPVICHHWTIAKNWNLREDAHGQILSPRDMKVKERIGRFIEHYERALIHICAGNKLTVTHSGGVKSKVGSVRLEGGDKSGKTFLASVVAQSAILCGLNTKFYSFNELASVLSRYENYEAQDKIAQEFATMNFIVIDNLDEENELNGPSLKFQLDRLARARIDSGQPTLFTSTPNFENKYFGHTWRSFIDSAFLLRLPSPSRRPVQ